MLTTLDSIEGRASTIGRKDEQKVKLPSIWAHLCEESLGEEATGGPAKRTLDIAQSLGPQQFYVRGHNRPDSALGLAQRRAVDFDRMAVVPEPAQKRFH